MREALIQAALWTRNEEQTSRIAGRAPAGRTLRITKSLTTLSSPVCAIADPLPVGLEEGDPTSCAGPGDVIETPEKLDIVTKVPASGRFTWWVNPSTRPYATGPESYHLSCEDGGAVLQETDVVVARGQTLNIDLPCGGTLPDEVTTTGGAAKGVTVDSQASVASRSARSSAPVAACALPLTARGGTVQGVRVALRRGSKTLAVAKLASLTGTRTVVVKARRKLARGRYAIRVSATGVKPVSKKVRLR